MERNVCKYNNLCKINFGVDEKANFDKVFLVPCCNRNLKQSKEYSYDSVQFSNNPITYIKELEKENCSCFVDGCNGTIGETKDIEVSLTRKCNLKCVMCGYDHSFNAAQEKIYKDTLENLKGNNLGTLTLTSEGEPFIYDWIYDYMKSLTSDDFKRVYILTNGTLIDDEKLEEVANNLKAKGIKLDIVISIHSFDMRTYAKIMRNKNFPRVLETAKLAYRIGILDGINYVIQPFNFSEYKNARKDADAVMKGLGDKIIYLLDFCNYSLDDIDPEIAEVIDNKM